MQKLLRVKTIAAAERSGGAHKPGLTRFHPLNPEDTCGKKKVVAISSEQSAELCEVQVSYRVVGIFSPK
jgi:hypothetical protein